MLTVKLITAGKMREKFYIEAYREYEKRLQGFCKWETAEIQEVKCPENASEKEIAGALNKEADEILEKIPQGSYVVAMCVEGKQLSSEEFAGYLEKQASAGVSEVCFIIGSSHGLSEKVKQKANLRLSVSKMTFPHELFRVMLLEQIYRAGEILGGSRYHK